MTDQEKNRFDALSIFWKQALDAISERRKYEWRMTFSVWAALATLAAALILKKLELSLAVETRSLVIVFLFIGFPYVCVAHYIFLEGVGYHHNIDRKLARATLEAIRGIQSLDFPESYVKTLDDSPATPRVLDWSRQVQFAVTVVLAIVDLMLFLMRL